MTRKRPIMWQMLATVVAMLTPLVCAAQQQAPSIETYKAPPDDYALGLLSSIFGSANGIFGGAENPSVNHMMLAFNVAVMAVGAAWFSYNIITATLQGSFDGEFLGRRYSSVWMPVRTVSGAGLLVPVWKGWNLAGLLMAFSASVGIGIGNTVWGGLEGEIVPGLVVAPSIRPLSEVVQPILDGRICIANRWADQARMKKANVDPSASEFSIVWASKPVSGQDFTAIMYGAQPAANGATEWDCGVAKLYFPPTDASDPDVQSVLSTTRTAMASALQGLDSDVAQLLEPARNMDPDDIDAVKNLEANVRQSLPDLVAARQAALDNAINAAVGAKNATVSQRIKDLTAKYGWLAAGATPLLVSVNNIDTARSAPELQSTAQKAFVEPVTVAAIDFGKAFFNQNLRHPIDSNIALWKAAGNVVVEAAKTAKKVWEIETPCGITSIGSDFIKKCVEQPLLAKISNAGIGSLVGVTSSNPLIYSQQLGIKILGIIGTVITAFLALIGVIGLAALGAGALSLGTAAAAGSIVASGINFFGFMLGLALIPLFIFSVQLVAYVPLMLTIAWIMAVGAWLLVVGESLIAATLWALVHLDPEGEGMGQRTSHGYIFVLNLLFRPSILVFSAYFAQRFCGVLGGFANSVMSEAIVKIMTANDSSLFVFLALMGAGIWITTSLNIKIVGTAASLMNLVPNQIFTWIGGHFGSDVGHGVSESVGHDVKGGMSSAGNTAGNAANMAGRAAGNKMDESGPGSKERGIDKAVKRMETEASAQTRFNERHADNGGGEISGPASTRDDSKNS